MKNTLRALALAVPMAASIAVGGTAFAQPQIPDFDIALPAGPVGPQGPGDIALPDEPVDPTDGPDDIAQPEPDGPGVDGPGDIANPEPTDPTDGPGDIVNPEDDPGTDHCDGLPEDPDYPEECLEQGDDAEAPDVQKPTRIDAGDAGSGIDLALILAGGAVIATGGAFAARRLARN